MNLFSKFLQYLVLPVFLLSTFLSSGLYAQDWQLTPDIIDASKFPRIKMSYSIRDIIAKKYITPDAIEKELTLYENGIKVPQIIKTECKSDTGPTELSVILVVDISGSMGERLPDGKTRMEYVREALKGFIERLTFYKRTSVAITAFGSRLDTAYSSWDNYRNVLSADSAGFTANKDTLVATINRMDPPRGGTNYNSIFWDTYDKFEDSLTVPYRMRQRPNDIRRVVIFLTDGIHAGRDTVHTNRIIDSLRAVRTSLYAVNVFMGDSVSADLTRIAEKSGGVMYKANSKDELAKIYDLLAVELQTTRTCTIEWDSQYGCSELSRTRKIKVEFKRDAPKIDLVSEEVSYLAPPNSVAALTPSSGKFVFFGQVAANATSTRTVRLTANNSPFRITQPTIYPASYEIVEIRHNGISVVPPINLPAGEFVDVVIKFKQGAVDNVYSEGQFNMSTTSPCPLSLVLVSGPFVKLKSPLADTVLSTCEGVTIEWAGISPDHKVNLTVIEPKNMGKDAIIAQNYSHADMKFLWQIKKPNKYKIRIDALKQSGYIWADQIGGGSDDEALAIDIDPNPNKIDNRYVIYVGGYFEGEATFGETTIKSTGGRDGFVAQYSITGKLNWVKTITSTPRAEKNNAEVKALMVDNDGNIYATGYFQQQANFGTKEAVSGTDKDSVNLFIAKYNSDPNQLSPEWIIRGVGLSPNNPGSSMGQRIGYFDTKNSGNFVVKGAFKSYVQLIGPVNQYGPTTTTKAGWDSLYVIFKPDGTIDVGVKTPAPPYTKVATSPYTRTVANSPYDGSRYEVGSFTGQKTYPSPLSNFSSRGKLDGFVHKIGETQQTSDSVTFTLVTPALELRPANTFDFAPGAIVNIPEKQIFKEIYNPTQIPINITSAIFTGPNAAEFSTANLVGLTIPPKSAINAEIVLNAVSAGSKVAFLDIKGNGDNCASARLTVRAEATPGCQINVKDQYTFDPTPIATPSGDRTIAPALVNNGTKALDYTITIGGVNAGDFVLKSPSSGQVAPGGGSLNVVVEFTPQGPGPRTATLTYNLPADAGCPVAQTVLNGFGADPELTIIPLDMGVRRQLTDNDSVVKIVNFGTINATIDSIRIVQATPQAFTIIGSSPKNIPLVAGDSLKINVRFNPAVLGPVPAEFIELYKNSQAQPLRAQLNGIGAVPVINANGFTFPGAPVNAPEQNGFITIRNNSADMDLVISSFAAGAGHTGDFKIDYNEYPDGLRIPKMDAKSIKVTFTPKSTGKRMLPVIITSDAAPGPDQNPKVQTTVELIGYGLTVGVEEPEEITTLLCMNPTMTFMINNYTGGAKLRVKSITEDPNSPDKGVFTLNTSGAFDIDADKQKPVEVTFNPPATGRYEASFIIENESDEVPPQSHPLKVRLVGNALKARFDITLKNVPSSITPAMNFNSQLNISTGDLLDYELKNFYVDVLYPSGALALDASGVTKTNPDWTVAPSVIAGGMRLAFSSTQPLAKNASLDLADLRFRTLLSEDDAAAITLESDLSEDECLELNAKPETPLITGFCFQGARPIRINEDFKFNVSPNPATGNAKIVFGVGLNEAPVLIELHNSMSQRVMTIVNETLKTGQYEADLSLDHLPSGIYFYTMSCGPYTETRQLVIVK